MAELDDLFSEVMSQARKEHVEKQKEKAGIIDGALDLASSFEQNPGGDLNGTVELGTYLDLGSSFYDLHPSSNGQTVKENSPVGNFSFDFGFGDQVHWNLETDPVSKQTFQSYTVKKSFRVDVIGFCERFYFQEGELPKYGQLHDAFVEYPECPPQVKGWKQILEDVKDAEGRSIQDRLEQRGLPTYNTSPDYLDPQFVTACHLILNTHDKRTTAAKLKDVGVSSARWNAWLKRKPYHKYYREHSKKLLESIQPEVEQALTRLVQNGDLSAIKYVDERTGEYNSQGDIGALLGSFLQAIFSVLARNVPSNVINIVQAEIRAEPAVKQVMGELSEGPT